MVSFFPSGKPDLLMVSSRWRQPRDVSVSGLRIEGAVCRVVWSVESVRSLVLIEIINTSSADTYQLNQSKSLWKQCTNRYQNHVKCNPMFGWKCDLVNCFVSFLRFKNIENGFGFLNFSFIWIHFGVEVICMILVLCS